MAMPSWERARRLGEGRFSVRHHRSGVRSSDVRHLDIGPGKGIGIFGILDTLSQGRSLASLRFGSSSGQTYRSFMSTRFVSHSPTRSCCERFSLLTEGSICIFKAVLGVIPDVDCFRCLWHFRSSPGPCHCCISLSKRNNKQPSPILICH